MIRSARSLITDQQLPEQRTHQIQHRRHNPLRFLIVHQNGMLLVRTLPHHVQQRRQNVPHNFLHQLVIPDHPEPLQNLVNKQRRLLRNKDRLQLAIIIVQTNPPRPRTLDPGQSHRVPRHGLQHQHVAQLHRRMLEPPDAVLEPIQQLLALHPGKTPLVPHDHRQHLQRKRRHIPRRKRLTLPLAQRIVQKHKHLRRLQQVAMF
uniref:(northern house mosquito) hypothetical protein n=1 Tax=Culex pipiens TaxID=7175 RepID=A0A8D8F0R1_CULPI